MISIPYGNSQIELNISDYFTTEADVYLPLKISGLEGIDAFTIQTILQNFDHEWPIDKNTSIAISVNDPTRPFPHHLILPPLLQYLLQNGARKGNISLFIATGTHRAPSLDELNEIIPSNILSIYRTIVHDCDDEENLTYLGLSQAGTPIYINKKFFQSEIKIVTGQIEPHHFMGFSGGVKSAVIGLGGRKTIEVNHKMLIKPCTKMNRYRSNPMRMDIEDIGQRIGIDCAFNVVLDNFKKVIGVFFDQPMRVMEDGIALSRKNCQINAPSNYDMVICSAGGFPKDINLYQAQKAITHACSFAREGGIILLFAQCRNGFGSEDFRKFIEKHQNPTRIIQAFEDIPFRIGPHKAYQLALQSQKYHIILVSEFINADSLKSIVSVTKSLDQGLNLSKQWLRDTDQAKIAVLPFATHIMNQTRA